MGKTQEVYEKLREDIISGNLQPNEILLHDEIATQLDVSRTPVREALGILEAREYVVRRGNLMVVANPSLSEIIDNLEIREALECKAISLACVRATNKQIAHAVDCLKNDNDAIASRDIPRFLQSNVELHRAVLCGCGCKTLMSFVFDWWHYHLNIIKTFSARDWRRVSREHAALVEGLCARDAAAASKAMRRHMRNTIEVAQKRLL